MIKVTLKGLFGTIAERKFETLESALEWLELQDYVANGAIGYTLETEVNENEKDV